MRRGWTALEMTMLVAAKSWWSGPRLPPPRARSDRLSGTGSGSSRFLDDITVNGTQAADHTGGPP